MFKRFIQSKDRLIIASLLFLSILLLVLAFFTQESRSLSPTPLPTPLPSSGQAGQATPTGTPWPTPTNTGTPTPTPQQTTQEQPAIPSVTSTKVQSGQTLTPAHVPYHVRVSIDGATSFSVDVVGGSNQCDILSKALQDGKISSLLMRYSESFSSNAVYQINGRGSESQVWWTYKVNGVSPPLGCSHIKANDNDSVEWTYVGS